MKLCRVYTHTILRREFGKFFLCESGELDFIGSIFYFCIVLILKKKLGVECKDFFYIGSIVY